MIDFVQAIGNNRPKIETNYYNKIVERYAGKQAMKDRKVFSYYWQCYAYAAIRGFISGKPKQLSGKTESPFQFSTVYNGSILIAQTLVTCTLGVTEEAKQLLIDNSKFIQVIDEYANAGFGIIALEMKEKGEDYFDEIQNYLAEIENRK